MLVIGQALWLFFRTLVGLIPDILSSLFSLYQTLTGINDQILAAIFGVSISFISFVGFLICAVKFFVNKVI